MANSTTNLDVISSSQASKEVTANALLDAASPATLYGRRASTTTALTWGFYGGMLDIAGTITAISNGTVALTASNTNYVVASRATGAVTASTATTNWNDSAGYIRLYSIVTGTATVTSYTDYRTVTETITATAAKAYADSLVVGLLDDRGNYDASVNTFPAAGGSGTAGAILKGDLWYISVAGTLSGSAVGIGDTVRALVDTPAQTASNWSIIENNTGFVPENSASKDATGGYAGLTLFKINFKNALDTFTSFFTNANTAARTYTFQDKDGTVPLTNDNLAVFASGGAIAPASINGVTTDSTTNKPVTAASLAGGALPASVTTLRAASARSTGRIFSIGESTYDDLTSTTGAIAMSYDAVTQLGWVISRNYSSASNTSLRISALDTTIDNPLAVTGAISSTTTLRTGGYTVATLPAGATGDRAYVTDATTPTWNAALTGGGAVVVPVFKNATAWVSA